jgi:hypothetical protein
VLLRVVSIEFHMTAANMYPEYACQIFEAADPQFSNRRRQSISTGFSTPSTAARRFFPLKI